MPGIIKRLLLAGLAVLVAPVAQAQLKVFACEPEWAALTTELAGDKAEVFAATHGQQDPHHIQARPSLIARLRSADLTVCTGAELESGWLPMLQRRARNPRVLPGNPGYFEATAQVELLEVPVELDRSEGDVHAAGNPHIQLDPRRLLQVAEALSVRLQSLDPDNGAFYRQRMADFRGRWQEAQQRWRARAEPLQGRRVIVHHREWTYLLEWLGMLRTGSLEPKPGVPPSLSHLARLKGLPADLIILSPLNERKPAQWLHEQSGVAIVTLPQTVGAEPAADDLFGLFDLIIARLTEPG